MLIYLVFITIQLFLLILSIKYSNIGKNKVVFLILFLLWVLFIGFRNSGYDFDSYKDLYNMVKKNQDINQEISFVFLSKISPNYRILLIIFSFITISLQFFYIKKVSPLPIFSLFILSSTLLFPTFMGQMRQGVAISFFAIAIYNYRNKILSFTFIIIASLFHTSALIGLIAIFIPNRIISKKYYLLIFISSFFLSNIISPYLSELVLLDPESRVGDSLSFYSQTEDYSLGFNSALLIRSILFLLCYSRKDHIQTDCFAFLLNVYFASIILYMSLGFIPQLGGRGTLYFAYFEIILFPFYVNSFDSKRRNLFIQIFSLFTLMRYIQFFNSDFNISQYVPY